MTSGTPVLPGLADLSPLGRGGMADVYLARQIHLERWVAAKVFRVTLSDEEAADRFRAECRALGRIDHYPHIVTVYDAGVLPDGLPYLISERCDGSLADLVAVRGPLPAERVAELGATVARALRFAHAEGVLHGDVTPRNVLLRSSGAPVLADFGLAVLRDLQDSTAAGFTMAHAAPEVLDGAAIDERTDVYGLGSTLYTALTGAAPFPRHPGEEDRERADRIRTEPVAPPPDVPERLVELVMAMLDKAPEDRPGTDEVVDALEETGAGAPTQRVPVGGAPLAAPATAASPAPAEHTRVQWSPAATPAARSSSRRPAVLVAAVLALLVLVGGGVAVALSSRSAPAPAAPVPATSARLPPPPAPTATSAAPSAAPQTRGTAPRRTATRTAVPDGGGPATPRAPQPTAPDVDAPSRTAGPPSSPSESVAPRLRAPAEPSNGGGAQRRVGPTATAEEPVREPAARPDAAAPEAGATPEAAPQPTP